MNPHEPHNPNPKPHDQEPHDQEPDPIFPDRLAQDLRALAHVEMIVPNQIEDDLRTRAQHHLAPRNRLRIHVRRAAPLAAAAGLAITAWIGFRAINNQLSTPAPTINPAARITMDIDGSGRVDILDAFVIARAIEAGSSLSSAWDVTDDGVVDLRDADAVAAKAVSLAKSSRS